jgi:hypothetical protein
MSFVQRKTILSPSFQRLWAYNVLLLLGGGMKQSTLSQLGESINPVYQVSA